MTGLRAHGNDAMDIALKASQLVPRRPKGWTSVSSAFAIQVEDEQSSDRPVHRVDVHVSAELDIVVNSFCIVFEHFSSDQDPPVLTSG